jgi:hypothetical protein
MCFSPEASFAGAAVLVPCGVYCVRAAATKDPGYLALACTPLAFGVQQFSEGVVWVGLGNGDPALARQAALVFLFFALFFWPFWVPFSLASAEPRPGTRALFWAFGIGALAFGWVLYGPVVFDPDGRLSVRVVRHSIHYDVAAVGAFAYPPGLFWALLYLASICLPLLVSLDRRLRVFALSLAFSWAVSYLAFRYAYESVWCFFAAVLSLQLCYVLYRLPPQGKEPTLRSGTPRLQS